MFRTERIEHDKDEIFSFVNEHRRVIAPRLQHLKNYYLGRHDILKKTVSDSTKPNNKLVNNYAKYITDMNVGYLVGNPITYSCDDDDLMKQIDDTNDYNDEQATNTQLVNEMSISGEAYEILYVDQRANVRFRCVPNTTTFVVTDNTLEENVRFGVYYRDVREGEKDVCYVDVYDSHMLYQYRENEDGTELLQASEHYFGDVPINRYINNTDCLGDFEPVMSLIDAYNKAQSNTLDDMDHFTDAYLVLINMLGTDAEDVAKLKEMKTLLLNDDGDAKWLIKDVNDTWVENYKNRIERDIHKFANTPALDSDGAAGNKTTIEIKMKLLAMEQSRVTKERYMKKSLQRRYEMIVNFLNLKGNNFDYLQIKPVFTANVPQNSTELGELVTSLMGVLSEETLLGILPYVSDVQEEMKRKKAEQEQMLQQYDNFEGKAPVTK